MRRPQLPQLCRSDERRAKPLNPRAAPKSQPMQQLTGTEKSRRADKSPKWAATIHAPAEAGKNSRSVSEAPAVGSAKLPLEGRISGLMAKLMLSKGERGSSLQPKFSLDSLVRVRALPRGRSLPRHVNGPG